MGKKRGGPVTTRRGQHHKYKKFKFVLVTDPGLTKIDSNVRQAKRDKFVKKQIQFEKRNTDPDYFHQKILDSFPELPVLANVFSLWQLRENQPELVPLLDTINNAKALCDSQELNRSCVYVRAGVTSPSVNIVQPTIEPTIDSQPSLIQMIDSKPPLIPSTVQLLDESSPIESNDTFSSLLQSTSPDDIYLDMLTSFSYIASEQPTIQQQQPSSQLATLSQASSHHIDLNVDARASSQLVAATNSSNFSYGDMGMSVLAGRVSVSLNNQQQVFQSARATDSNNFDITICSMKTCRKFMSEPITLPCLDSFCLQCLENIEQTGAWAVNGPSCPECGLQFLAPPNGLSSIATNSFIQRLVQLRRIENLDDDDHSCETCSQSTTADAVGYCIDCQQKLCQNCCESHKKIRITKTHVIAPLGGSSVLGSLNEVKSLHCYNHSNNQSDLLYCASCSQLLCSDCLPPHTNHELETDADAVLRYRNELSRCSNDLSNDMNRLMIVENKLDHADTDLAIAEKEIREKADNLKAMIDRHSTALLDQLTTMHETAKATREKRVTHVKSISKAVIVAQELTSKGSDYDLLSLSPQLVNYVNQFIRTIDVGDTETAVTRFCFRPSDAWRKFEVDSNNVIGSVVEVPSAGGISESNYQDLSVSVEHRKMVTASPAESKSPTLKHVIPSDGRDARGLTFINNELFVLRQPSKKKIQVYETSTFTQQRTVRVAGLSDDGYWCCKTLTSCDVKNCLFVCDGYNVYKVDLSTNNVINWQVDGRPTGLSVNNARHVIVTCWDSNEIREYKPNGQLIRTIKLQKSHVTWPFHSVQLADSQFIVSHQRPVDGVSLIDTRGSVIATYRNSQSTKLLNYPRQLTVTENGSVLVADCDNNRLVVLDISLKNARELTLPIDGGLNRPWCLYFNELLGQLYVGESGGERVVIFDNIKIE